MTEKLWLAGIPPPPCAFVWSNMLLVVSYLNVCYLIYSSQKGWRHIVSLAILDNIVGFSNQWMFSTIYGGCRKEREYELQSKCMDGLYACIPAVRGEMNYTRVRLSVCLIFFFAFLLSYTYNIQNWRLSCAPKLPHTHAQECCHSFPVIVVGVVVGRRAGVIVGWMRYYRYCRWHS